MSLELIQIRHKDHGDAICDDRQIAEFEALGWKRTIAEATADSDESQDAAKKAKPAKKPHA